MVGEHNQFEKMKRATELPKKTARTTDRATPQSWRIPNFIIVEVVNLPSADELSLQRTEVEASKMEEEEETSPEVEGTAKDDENEICLVGMKSAGNELVSTIGSSVELGIASQIQMPLNHHFYGVCFAPDFSKGWHLCQLEVLDCKKVAWSNSVTEEKYCVQDCGWPLKEFAYECKINLLTGRTHQWVTQCTYCCNCEMIDLGLIHLESTKKQCTSEYDKAIAMQEWISYGSVTPPSEASTGFDDMVSETKRKYYMLGGKGGVGKTSCAASLAVKFANNGHPTLVVSTDPAHSLSDSFAQDLTGGTLVPVEGPDLSLNGSSQQINPEKAREEFRSTSQKTGGNGIKDFMDGMGLGMIVDQLGELKLGELLDTPPPGLDEAIAISKVIQFLESREYNMFTRIVFDTAPTGHTLRLLSLPDFLDASIGKILKLKQKIASATSAIKSVFGQEDTRSDPAEKLERLRDRMIKVRELFHDKDSTEFVIVTIPTVMAISESSRLCASLKKENVPVKRLIVNQVLPPSASDCKFCAMKRKAPLVDVEIRGVPALQFLGDIVWK
ncbi:ATPase ARSA1 [Camellia lanceoleosa]|uniref:ATPase ARSA1 n=1 Tax=Camellia lanceoleosa TaxID=1840588 RepID=A0ACC0H5E3_9ERIC|nr:ATPase ARSA1 [Camellia lanceoleosa]